MLELTAKIRLKEKKREKVISNNRVIKTYKGYGIYRSKSMQKKNYITFYIDIFGDQNDITWHQLTGSWVIGKFQIQNVGDHVIFASTDLKALGIMPYDTQTNPEKQQEKLDSPVFEDVLSNMPEDTKKYLDSALDLSDV